MIASLYNSQIINTISKKKKKSVIIEILSIETINTFYSIFTQDSDVSSLVKESPLIVH